jgi:hypothetical protein
MFCCMSVARTPPSILIITDCIDALISQTQSFSTGSIRFYLILQSYNTFCHMPEESRVRAAQCCISLGLLLTVILVPSSFQYVDFTEYGLKYNTVTKVVEPKAFEATRAFGGLTAGFHIFPRPVQMVIFNGTDLKKSISLKDKIGGSFECELSLGYRLEKEHLYQIFSTYKMNYESSFLTNIRAAVRQGAQKYSMLDFVQDGRRQQVEKYLFTTVDNVLKARYTLTQNAVSPSFDNSSSYEKCPDGKSCDFKGGARLEFLKLGLVTLDKAKEGIIMSTQKNQIDTRIIAEETALQAISEDTKIAVLAQEQNLTTLKQTKQAEIIAAVTIIGQNESKIVSDTTKRVQEISALSAKNIKDFEADTSNLIEAKRRPLNLVQQTTKLKLNEILQQTEQLRAAKDQQLKTIRANAKATVDRIIGKARSIAEKTKAAAVKTSFQAFASKLQFTPSELNALHFTDLISSHSGKNMKFDIQRPTKLQLDGQQELYYDTLYDPASSRL